MLVYSVCSGAMAYPSTVILQLLEYSKFTSEGTWIEYTPLLFFNAPTIMKLTINAAGMARRRRLARLSRSGDDPRSQPLENSRIHASEPGLQSPYMHYNR